MKLARRVVEAPRSLRWHPARATTMALYRAAIACSSSRRAWDRPGAESQAWDVALDEVSSRGLAGGAE